MKITDRKIIKKKVIKESVKTLWWKWTTHEGLLTFFGEDNKIELKPFGTFEIYFFTDQPYGSRGSETCRVLSFLPEKMFSFTWNAPPQYEEVRASIHKTWVVVNFNPLPDEGEDGNTDRGTEVELIHLGWPEDERWDPVFDYFDKAWETVLKWLDESCSGWLFE